MAQPNDYISHMAATGNIDRLRWCATLLVVLTFILAGIHKILVPDAGLTMVGRYLSTPNAVRALGCMETAIALWLISGRSLRLALVTAGGVLIGLTLLIGVELQRDSPLPCGCLPSRPGMEDPYSARRGLWVAAARNAFLVSLCAIAGVLARETTNAQRYADGISGTKLSDNPYRR